MIKQFILSDWCGELNISPIIDMNRQTHLTYLQILKILNGLEKDGETDESVSFNERFKWVYIGDGELELLDNGIVRRFNNIRLEELLNNLHRENTYLKSELNRYKHLKEENEKLKIALSEYGVDFSSLDELKEALGYDDFIRKNKG